MSRKPPAFRAVTVPLSPLLGESATPIGTSLALVGESLPVMGVSCPEFEGDLASSPVWLDGWEVDPVFAGGTGTGRLLVTGKRTGKFRPS
jgi:hypothetical protein